jgi:hypothetical protein
MRSWRVGEVQWLRGRDGEFSEWAFVLYKQSGEPFVTFVYSHALDARAGRDQVEAALTGVVSVKASPP